MKIRLLISIILTLLMVSLAKTAFAHDNSSGTCNHYYGNGAIDWIACCGPNFCSGNNMVNWCTTCQVTDDASDPTNHDSCFTSAESCPGGRSTCEISTAVAHELNADTCTPPSQEPDPPDPTITCNTNTFRSTGCGFNGDNWCELGKTCSTGWVDGPIKNVVCPASTKLVNTGEYCTSTDGPKKFTATADTKCEIDSSCSPPQCSGFSLSKTSDIVVGEWISADFISAKSNQKNYLYVTDTGSGSTVYLIAPNFSRGSSFDVPTIPGTYRVPINAYDSDCLSFFDWTGNWKKSEGCGAAKWSNLSSSGSTGCSDNITVRGLRISGTVQLPDGTGYTGGATITLTQGTTTIATTTSSTNGTYSFNGLLIGTYTITLTVPANYQATTANSITLTATSDSSNKNFTIRRLPSVTTNNATSITVTSATLNSTINPNGTATTSWFRYSSTNQTTCNDTFGTRVPTSGSTNIGSGTTDVSDSRSLTSLTTGTTYYFCAIGGVSSPAATVFGSVLSFIPTSDPDFSISVTPASRSIAVSQTADYKITVGRVNSHSGTITLSAPTLPSGAIATFYTGTDATCTTPTTTVSGSFTVTATGCRVMRISGASQTTPTSPNITVRGTSGTLTHDASVTLTVSATAQPDLVTQDLTYTAVAAGSSMTFSGKVSNAGSANALASSARFCIDNASCLTSTTGRVGTADSTVSALNAGAASGTITSASWTATAGAHTVYFCADVGAAVTEANEDNNCSNSAFTITGSGDGGGASSPWIQTKGGNVHSNTSINTPGGP